MDVAQPDPHAAVVASLAAPSDFSPEPEPIAWPVELVPRARSLSHGPFARDPAAIAVIKERESIDRRLYAVTFDDLTGNRWFWLVAAERSERGWAAHGVAGGSNGPAEPERGTPRPSSVGARPSLDVCGQWGSDTFYAGGRLDRAGYEIGRVQLTLDDGSQLEDDGLADVALFIGRHGESPRTVDIYAPDGALLSSHNA
jgi:hypothetical protein